MCHELTRKWIKFRRHLRHRRRRRRQRCRFRRCFNRIFWNWFRMKILRIFCEGCRHRMCADDWQLAAECLKRTTTPPTSSTAPHFWNEKNSSAANWWRAARFTRIFVTYHQSTESTSSLDSIKVNSINSIKLITAWQLTSTTDLLKFLIFLNYKFLK